MRTDSRPAWVFLFGPTAVGKTQTLLDLREQGLPIEVISADAFQVYRGLDIGTAKPNRELLSRVPHHLIDICSPHEIYNVSSFLSDARAVATDIRRRHCIPVVSGGTAFYYRHLLLGLPEAPGVDEAVRAAIGHELKERGLAELYQDLCRSDPGRAEQVHPNDSYRICRALEIIRSTGKAQSSFGSTGRGGLLNEDAQVLILGLERPREELRQRIKLRVDMMFEAGLPAEVQGLKDAGLGEDAPAMRAIGYREFFEESDLALVREKIFFHTSQYAKRQMTFFRSFENAQWFPATDTDGLAARLDQAINS